ncbi:MAG: endonuclease/exonuclease/phosphatase family protein [Geminicoccaceae bacterium]|nr:endonuclease/exonuclease/phosphatase family protein [Geminicoccaceae bacterium]
MLDIVTTTVSAIDRPLPEWRRDALAGGSHDRWFEDARCLHQIELHGPVTREGLPRRVVAWNAERLKYLDASIARLREVDADVMLITEVDCGMARSGNRHTVRDLARELGMSYAFGVEFIELGLGDARERKWHEGQSNADGLHGAAILSRMPIEDATLLRLDRDGTWYDGDRNGERRVGGRIAMLARIGGVVMACVHLESHSDPRHRAGQMKRIFEVVDDMSGGGPVILGGDLNTKSAGRDEWLDDAIRGRLLAEDPSRRMNPVPHEPMFEVAAVFGYDIERCNDDAASERLRPGDPEKELGRIDWFMTRSVDILAAETLAAVDGNGVAISDHEILSITLRAE